MASELHERFRIVYLAHSLRSDWNNGNAHFLRGLMRSMCTQGHTLTLLEPKSEWSIDNLRTEARGEASVHNFEVSYSDLSVTTYTPDESDEQWIDWVRDAHIVILHEWNPPELARRLLILRDLLGFKLLFHDTHHRASSSPEQIGLFGLAAFDGILVFGASLKKIYQERLHIERVWVLHEAADTTIFHPLPGDSQGNNVVWIGNWGEGERTSEINEYYLGPAATLASEAKFTIYGVRYPEEARIALDNARVCYAGYLPNLDAPAVYHANRLTVHIPRQQYNTAMMGIPTIRVFEALACGIPLISAPWHDSEQMFRPGDFRLVQSGCEMTAAMRTLLNDPAEAAEQARAGLETVLARHTCAHRARELTSICKELLT